MVFIDGFSAEAWELWNLDAVQEGIGWGLAAT